MFSPSSPPPSALPPFTAVTSPPPYSARYGSDDGSATEEEHEDGLGGGGGRCPGPAGAAAEASPDAPQGSEMAGDELGGGAETKLCYVCCDEHVDPTNPLISACNCKGGTKWVHLGCLQTILNGAATTGDRACVIMSPLAATCRVCRSEYRRKCKLVSESRGEGAASVSDHRRPVLNS